jgi:hypothetical protein
MVEPCHRLRYDEDRLERIFAHFEWAEALVRK